jgi:hypothetical protein
MIVLRALTRGIQGLRGRLRYIVLVDCIYLLALLIPFTLFFKSISGAIGHSPLADHLTGGFDLAVIFDIAYSAGPALAITLGSLWPLLLLIIFTELFLEGGILYVILEEREGSERGEFFRGCADYFFPFLRLLLLSLSLFIVAAGIYLVLGGLLNIIKGRLSDEVATIWILGLKAAIIFVLLCSINLFLDYAKISMVATSQKRASRHLWASLSFLRRHKVKAAALYSILVGTVILSCGLYWIATGHLSTGTWTGLLIIILIQQSLVLFRIAMRFLFFSSQGAFFDMLLPSCKSPRYSGEPED